MTASWRIELFGGLRALSGERVVTRFRQSCAARWIAANAGYEGSVVVEKVKGLPTGHGFNALTEEYGDMVGFGVVDPVKVVRSALQNAASIAGMLLTTEALIAEKPEDKPPAAPAPHMDY